MAAINVHQTTLAYENSYIFVSNVRIPPVFFRDPNIAQRIYQFVNQEYYPNEVTPQFEITAAYTLIHRESAARRKWVGSFSPQQNFSLTSMHLFKDTFFQVITPLLDIGHLSRQIDQLVPNTDWTLDEVEALIVNVSAVVPSNYPRLVQRGLISQYAGGGGGRGSRRQRKVKSFDLP